MIIQLKRPYAPYTKRDGYRILVDRLWPRGLKKENAHIDLWYKEIAPSEKLRKWFSHDPKKWDAFREKYIQELKDNSNLVEDLLAHVKKHKVITLLFSASDKTHNNAVVLQQFLQLRFL